MESDATYFRRRAFEEHLAAVKADDPNARRAHRELAARYDDLSREIALQGQAGKRVGIWI